MFDHPAEREMHRDENEIQRMNMRKKFRDEMPFLTGFNGAMTASGAYCSDGDAISQSEPMSGNPCFAGSCVDASYCHSGSKAESCCSGSSACESSSSSCTAWSAIQSGHPQWPCRVNRTLNLKACLFLEQSQDDAVLPMGKADSVLAIHRAAIQMLRSIGHREHGDRAEWNEKIFENAVALSQILPVYRLRVSLTGRFWEKIEAVLDKWTVPLFPVAGESLANSKG